MVYHLYARFYFKRKHGVGQKNDEPQQFRSIGWCGGLLGSVIFEIRHDSDGEYLHLITAWKATQQEERMYAENI